jgi:HEAT repeat protein
MIEDDTAVEALIDAVEDDDEEVRQNALWAISQIMG